MLTLSFRVGFKSLVSRVSFIFQWGPFAYTMATARTTPAKMCFCFILKFRIYLDLFSLCLLVLKLAHAEYATNAFSSK